MDPDYQDYEGDEEGYEEDEDWYGEPQQPAVKEEERQPHPKKRRKGETSSPARRSDGPSSAGDRVPALAPVSGGQGGTPDDIDNVPPNPRGLIIKVYPPAEKEKPLSPRACVRAHYPRRDFSPPRMAAIERFFTRVRREKEQRRERAMEHLKE